MAARCQSSTSWSRSSAKASVTRSCVRRASRSARASGRSSSESSSINRWTSSRMVICGSDILTARRDCLPYARELDQFGTRAPAPGLTNVYCAAVGRPAAAQDVLLDLARGRLGQLVDELNSWPSTLCRGYIEASPTLGRRSLPRACYLETSVHPARVPLRLPRGMHHPEHVGPRASCAERCQAGGGA